MVLDLNVYCLLTETVRGEGFSRRAQIDSRSGRSWENQAPVCEDDHNSLIAALKRREPAAWNAVVHRHLGEVYGFVFHLSGNDRAVAEELTQETWLEAVAGIDRCDSARGCFRNWLLGIARRRVALHFRRRAGRKDLQRLGDCMQELEDLDTEILPQDAMEQAERTSAVRAALLALPQDRRTALVCKYVEGLSVDAMAARLGKTAKAIESLLGRARAQMRSLLGDYLSDLVKWQEPIRNPTNEQSRSS
jgi:RNA polymerase sigma-70 factor (ECF subfamily)